MFIWSTSFSGTPKIILKHIPDLVKIYSIRKIPRSNEENESINVMIKTLACVEELMKNISTRLQRLEEIHSPQANDVFGKPRERRKVIAIDNHKERREFDDIHISLLDALEILSKKGYLKPLEPNLLPNPIPRSWNMNEYCVFHQKLRNKTNNCFRLKHEIFKTWLMVGWLSSQDSRDEARSNEGMCLRDLIHVNTFARGWAILILLSLFQLSSLHFVKSIWVFLNVMLLSFSICCVVESCFFEFSY